MRPSSFLLMAFAIVASVAVAVAQTPRPSPPRPRPSPPPTPTAYRLISITKWNTTANITGLQGAEEIVSKACQNFFVAGITGFSLQRRTDPVWGSHIKVYDFPTLTAYTNYSTCVASQPLRSVSQAFEVWKNRVIYPYFETVAAATTFADGTYWYSAIANSSNAASFISLAGQINTELSALLSTVKQVAANTPNAVSLPLNVAHLVGFLKAQGATAFLGYLNDPPQEGVPILPAYAALKSITPVARRILFVPKKLK